MQIYEPRQIRKEAAVNRHLHVPLALLGSSPELTSFLAGYDEGCTTFKKNKNKKSKIKDQK
jgi:hypothetical protein